MSVQFKEIDSKIAMHLCLYLFISQIKSFYHVCSCGYFISTVLNFSIMPSKLSQSVCLPCTPFQISFHSFLIKNYRNVEYSRLRNRHRPWNKHSYQISCLQNHDSCSLNEVIYHKMTFIKVNTNFGSTQSKGKKLCQIKYFNKDLAPIRRIPLFSYVE